MTLAELKTLLSATGYQVAYQSFPQGSVPSMPFIVYTEVRAHNFGADNKVYHSAKVVDVVLYTRQRDTVAEAAVENALANEFWTKELTFVDDELCTQVTYTLEI